MDRKNSRSIALLIVLGCMFFMLIARLFYLQIVKGQDYADNFLLQIRREITLPGTRGNIYDRNGRPMAVDQLAWSVTIEDQETYNSDRERQLALNSKIYKTLCMIKEHGDAVKVYCISGRGRKVNMSLRQKGSLLNGLKQTSTADQVLRIWRSRRRMRRRKRL